jgi:cyclopropane fatty-acyl-phospholipid synthase-like methyltransferase
MIVRLSTSPAHDYTSSRIYTMALIACGGALFLTHCRDCPNLGSYDKVVSIEMIEAVGHEHLVSYFATINAALKPGGKAVIQVRNSNKSMDCMLCMWGEACCQDHTEGTNMPGVCRC